LNAFEVLFILLVLVTLVCLAIAIWLLIVGQKAAAKKLLRQIGVEVAVYLATVLVGSMITPRETLSLGDPLCFDDWCISVTSVNAHPGENRYQVSAEISSRARRVPQRETGVQLVMVDAAGSRYRAENLASDLGFDLTLSPGESTLITRSYLLPAGTRPAGVEFVHENGFPITWFIIGQGPFQSPPIFLVPASDQAP